jgi:hypothetical protein
MLVLGREPEQASLTLAFLLYWHARDAGIGLTLASGKGARIGSLILVFLLQSITDIPVL